MRRNLRKRRLWKSSSLVSFHIQACIEDCRLTSPHDTGFPVQSLRAIESDVGKRAAWFRRLRPPLINFVQGWSVVDVMELVKELYLCGLGNQPDVSQLGNLVAMYNWNWGFESGSDASGPHGSQDDGSGMDAVPLAIVCDTVRWSLKSANSSPWRRDIGWSPPSAHSFIGRRKLDGGSGCCEQALEAAGRR